MPAWIRRTTLWETDRGELVQVAVAVLDEQWDPQAEVTTPLGPFDSPTDAVVETTEQAELAAWWQTRQQTLL
jgi:hypothetical protein